MTSMFKFTKLHIFIFFLFFTATTNLTFAQSTVKLSGKLLNFNNQVEIKDNSELSDLRLRPSNRMIIPDSLNNFKIEFILERPNYFMIGRNLLYLTPGDIIIIEIDNLDPYKSTFKGSHVAENYFLKNVPLPKMASFLQAGSNIKKTIEETIDTIKLLTHIQQDKLSNTIGINDSFKSLESSRIKADFINSLENITRYFLYINKVPKDSFMIVLNRTKFLTQDLIDSVSNNFLNEKYLKLAVYRDVIKHMNLKEDKISNKLNDFLSARSIFYKISKLSEKSKIAVFEDSIKLIKDTEYRNELMKSYDELMSFGNGDKAIDFIAKNEKGEAVSLSAQKGKVIVLDFWATWCGPCVSESLYFDKLRDKYKGREITFISISIDEDKKKWLSALSSKKATGLQWNISKNKIGDYAVNAVPRTIVIDKDFKIQDINSPLPSNIKLNSFIETLLKNK